MECNDSNNRNVQGGDSVSAVNSLILDYYKKFGRKRDLEQFFSLSTAETEVKDVTSLFWRRMKSEDSSDSGGKKSESSTELCRISIKCSLPEPSSSQDEVSKTKSDADSPPIIMEEVQSAHTDEESFNEDNHSQQSMDAILETSINKPLSPSSSVTSQRKLEWDSLADVGYANESDRKASASSLSTLERLALKQQYSNNDSKHDTEIGTPKSHSTPVETKPKKGPLLKTTKIYQKDVDVVEVNVPKKSDKDPTQAISVNLTKHISFNMDKDGGVTVENVKNDINVAPDPHSTDPDTIPLLKTDKEIQTSLTRTKEKDPVTSSPKPEPISNQKIPVLISLNTIRRNIRRKKPRVVRRQQRNKRKKPIKEYIPVQEKSTDQISAAESFEYMPGHVYNQNQINFNQPEPIPHTVDNKSSSCGAVTSDSSKGSKHSFTKDLEKSVDLLTAALHKQKNNSELKNKLIKQVVERLLKAKYRDDDSTTEFLSGLSFSSKRLGLGEGLTTSSTTDTSNNTDVNKPIKPIRPKKSILRLDKFNSNVLASTSQSAPNLPSVLNTEKPVIPKVLKQGLTNTESDMSSGGKHSSDTAFAKTSSEELYQKYLDALRREEAYKRHLREKEMFLKQKLVCSDTAFTPHMDKKANSKLKDLIKDLTRNNYDDGSGDASKLEGGTNFNVDPNRLNASRTQRSHSVFTLSSGNSEDNNRKSNLKKRLQNEIKQSKVAQSVDDHRCTCSHRYIASKVGVTDSSVQVNLKHENAETVPNIDKTTSSLMPCCFHKINRESHERVAHVIPDDITGDIKYVCVCSQKSSTSQDLPTNMLIYKCSQLAGNNVQSSAQAVQCMGNSKSITKEKQSLPSTSKNSKGDKVPYTSSENTVSLEKSSKSSQTNVALRIMEPKSNERSYSPVRKSRSPSPNRKELKSKSPTNKMVLEVTRCIQTEISINPRISDPSLGDINLISEQECVKLICERYKEISKRANDSDPKPTSDINFSSEASTKSTFTKSVVDIANVDSSTCGSKSNKDIVSNTEPNNNDLRKPIHKEENYASDNYTIPIQGTNMTLMVKIGSNTGEYDEGEIKSHNVGTDKPQVTEKGTCLNEECSKGVQSCTTDIFTDIRKSPRSSPKMNTRQKDNLKTFYQYCQAKTISDRRGNTFPRKSPPTSKPFLRSNTHNGKFSSTCAQTDNIEKTDAVTQESESKESDSVKSDLNKSLFSCHSDKSSKAGSSKSLRQKDCASDCQSQKSSEYAQDPILEIIKDITKRYSKQEIEKSKRKQCFKEIVKVLNYLLNTEDGTDVEKNKCSDITSTDSCGGKNIDKNFKSTVDSLPIKSDCDSVCGKKDEDKCTCRMKAKEKLKKSPSKKDNKGVQSCCKMTIVGADSTESEFRATSEVPGTSSESTTCKVLNNIKKECDKYHQKRCKSNHTKKVEVSSSTSVHCNKCKCVPHCQCRGHKNIRTKHDKSKKKCLAYNLMIQTSDSLLSDGTMVDTIRNPLQNVIVKLPHKRTHMENAPFKEVFTKIEKTLPASPRGDSRTCRSRSWPNESEISSNDDYTKGNCGYTVREYLEINRPDFVEKCSRRQQCLKSISEKRASERAAHRQVLSVQLDQQPSLKALSETQLRRLARDLGVDLKRKKLAPKFISEREMKQHSEKIYKSLPEVVQKKEEAKKENAKKTNLLMANIFKKNLQKKTLKGSVNLSNYNTVIKI